MTVIATPTTRRRYDVEISPDPKSHHWGTPGWPDWVKGFRPNQLDAVEQIMELYRNGYDAVLLDAPTGSGKTIIAEMVRRLLRVEKALYMANTNSLVDQFAKDFPYAARLKGKSNYPTYDDPASFDLAGEWRLTCGDCEPKPQYLPACEKCPEATGNDEDNVDEAMRPHCRHCHPFSSCPYRVARMEAVESALCITNTNYFISDVGLGRSSGFSGENTRGLVIADECDTLESILLGHIEVSISNGTARDLGMGPPTKKTVESSWLEWVDTEAVPKVSAALKAWKSRNSGRDATTTALRERKKLERLAGKLSGLKQEIEDGNIVYDGYKDGDIIFRPVKVDAAAPELLWGNGKKWLCMSATLFADEFIDSVGLENTTLKYGVVKMASTFPKERRPIYYRGVANNTFKNRDAAWPQIAQGIRDVLEERPDARVLIHTVSYSFTEFLMAELRGINRPLLTHRGADQRTWALDELRKTPRAVLLSPSMDRGVDLPGDQCDLVIVTKMPFLSTADKQVAARMYSKGGQTWYAVSTLKSLVQMTGRGMRSADDLCETFILDQQFHDNVWRNHRRMLPDWWSESVDWTGGL